MRPSVTTEQPEAAPAGLITRGRHKAAAVVATVAASFVLLILGSESAFATTPDCTTDPSDLTCGAGDQYFSKITTYFQQHVIVSTLALFALVVGVGVLMKWGRKAARA